MSELMRAASPHNGRARSCKILCTRRGNAAGGRKQIPFAAK